MTYAEFKEMFPEARGVTENNFPLLRMQAETVVQELMAYEISELTEAGQKVYNDALCLQIAYMAEHGATEGNLVSQTINGTTMTFALSNAGGDAVKVSPLVRAKLRSSGLCVRF